MIAITNKSLLATALTALLSLATFTTAAPVFGRSGAAHAVFGLPRGGGLFGKGKEATADV